MPRVWVQSRDLGFPAHGCAPQAQPCSHVLWGSHVVPYTMLCSTFLTAPGLHCDVLWPHLPPRSEGGERNADVLLLAPHLFNSSFSVCRRAPIPPFSAFGHACPNAWVGFQGKCYYFSKEENDWNSSREHCSAHGASLATIGSAEEMVRWGHEPKALGKAPGWGGTAARYCPTPSRIHLGDIPRCAPPGAALVPWKHKQASSMQQNAAPCSLLEPELWVGQMLKPPNIQHSLPLKDFMMRFQGLANCRIGLHREEEDAQWMWSDGTAFTNWSVCLSSCHDFPRALFEMGIFSWCHSRGFA